ncbi:MAG: uroporphyrinogen decarboxylase [Actinobacteria bacterium]|nr:MAG: uroporphyrinogen decarboxylase [Actinomycetota bacterium]
MAPSADRTLRALRREPVDRTPIWFMRQAGRYLPEYRDIRGDRDILETILIPDEAVEITLQPLLRMPLDAAILFSDIVVPLVAIGIPFRIEAGRGPVLDEPFRSRRHVARLRPLEPEVDEPYTLEAVRALAGELDVPLLGFAGAPFTLASYLVEGGPSRDHARTKALMFADPLTWDALMGALVDVVVPHLRAQVGAGASALQVFDPWVGALAPAHYRAYILPHMRRLFEGIADLTVPVIHFGVGTSELLELMRDAGGAAIGIDHRTPLDRAWERLGHTTAIQGNLDPAVLLAPWEVVEREALDILDRAGGRAGHVFNLGHGVLPDTPVDNLQRLVDLVHARSERDG